MTWQSEIRAWAVASAAVFCLGAIGYRVTTAPDLTLTVASLNAGLQSIPATLNHVQTTSDQATEILRAARPVVAAAETTENKLGAAIDLTSHRINDQCLPGPCGTLADTNRTLATLRGTSGQVEKSLLLFNKHEADLFTQESDAYKSMQKSVTDFDALVSNPDIPLTLAAWRSASVDAAATVHDGHDWLHQKLYPTKRKGFVSGFEAAGDVAKHWMPPLF